MESVESAQDVVYDHVDISDMVELIDYMGSDATVVNSARVSLGASIDETQPLREQDKRLIKFLAKNNHITPFFHPILRFRLTMPIYIAREWYRHNIGLARNEISRRYVTIGVECFLADEIRERHPNKKQGSKDTSVENNEECRDIMRKSMEASMTSYRELLKNNVAPEIARSILPQAMMTSFIETGSLAAYARIYKLRADPNSQLEIQLYAKAIGNLIKERYPVSWAALTEESS